MIVKVKLNGKLITPKIKMLDESDMTKCLRSLRKYNMRAYKQFIFETNDLVHVKDNEYRINFLSDNKFQKIYGQVYMSVTLEKDEITLNILEPHDFFIAGHNRELESYKGIPIVSQKEKFKIDFLNKMGGFDD